MKHILKSCQKVECSTRSFSAQISELLRKDVSSLRINCSYFLQFMAHAHHRTLHLVYFLHIYGTCAPQNFAPCLLPTFMAHVHHRTLHLVLVVCLPIYPVFHLRQQIHKTYQVFLFLFQRYATSYFCSNS